MMHRVLRRSSLALALALAAACPAIADQTPRWSVSDPAALAALESDLERILNAPFDPDASKDVGDQPLPESLRRLMSGDADLREAYRAQPEATLDLLARIRAAGGGKTLQ